MKTTKVMIEHIIDTWQQRFRYQVRAEGIAQRIHLGSLPSTGYSFSLDKQEVELGSLTEWVVEREKTMKIHMEWGVWDKYLKCGKNLVRVAGWGRYPDVTKGTYIPIFIKERLEKGQWGAKVESIWNNALILSVMTPPQCILGRFRMYVAVMTPYGIRRTARDKDTDIYILFNPWEILGLEEGTEIGKGEVMEEYENKVENFKVKVLLDLGQ
eukprot:g40575.t1